MRKVSIALASCAALVAFMALTAPALAATRVDPGCDLDNPEWGDGTPGPYNNEFTVHDLTVSTPDSSREYEVSGVSLGALACGTEISSGPFPVGEETLNDHARIELPPGVSVNRTDDLPPDSYVGRGGGRVATWGGLPFDPQPLTLAVEFTLRTDDIFECERENQNLIGGPEPGTVIACYRGTAELPPIPSHNWSFVLREGDSHTLVVGPLYSDVFPQQFPAGLTSLDATLCAYAGSLGPPGEPGECGDGSDPDTWLRKNGRASTDDLPEPCAEGDGVYTMTVTGRGGQTTAPASNCVLWETESEPFEVGDGVDLLDEANVRIEGGPTEGRVGYSIVSAGDLNGDGIQELIVGAPEADPSGRQDAGTSYLVFGQSSQTSIDLGQLGDQGFRIDGAAAGDRAGSSVAATGDLSGDGKPELIVGAPAADPSGRSDVGSAYVVFGKSGTGSVDLAHLGTGGFRIDGAAAGDESGISVAGAGDLSGDGKPEIIVGAPGADPSGHSDAGSTYVVFGKSGTGSVDLAQLGTGGFRIDGGSAGEYTGWSVAGTGDVNGDSVADVALAAGGTQPGSRPWSSSAFVVFGKPGPEPVDLGQLGVQGFRIDGDAYDMVGPVADAGDVNGDGQADVVVGARYADRSGRADAGSAYVVFGTGQTDPVDLTQLGDRGFRMDGAATGDVAGWSVTGVGDWDGDGLSDLAVGAPQGYEVPDEPTATDGLNRIPEGPREDRSHVSFGPGGAQVVFATCARMRVDYRPREIVANVGKPVDPLVPDTAGATSGEAGFTVTPALPGGLSLDPATGEISGTPAAAQELETYKVTMDAGSGCVATEQISIRVKRQRDPWEEVDLRDQDDVQVDGEIGAAPSGLAGSRAGWSVSDAGDVNGDGHDDVVIGSPYLSVLADFIFDEVGSTYVVFGPEDPASIDLSDLGGRGFRIVGGDLSRQKAGFSVAGVGDVNDDGLSDLAIAAPGDYEFGWGPQPTVYVVFGKESEDPVYLDSPGDWGFRIDYPDNSQISIAGAGDVNGDSRDDVIVGTPDASVGTPDPSGVYVVFGKPNTDPVDLSQLGQGGFKIGGIYDGEGYSVSAAGDLNGDGLDDVIVGAPYADYGGRSDSGSAYVVFGKTDSATIFLSYLGDRGFRIDGATSGDGAGRSVSGAGDVNQDGRPDLIVGAPDADYGSGQEAGSAYVVFGRTATVPIDLGQLGDQGFRIDGAAAGDRAGSSVAVTEDVNGDRRADLIVGAPYADPSGRDAAGAAYLVVGKAGSEPIDLGSLSGRGYRVIGAASGDEAGFSVSGAGDVNGDHYPDLVVGGPGADSRGREESGSAYILFSPPLRCPSGKGERAAVSDPTGVHTPTPKAACVKPPPPPWER